VHVVDDECDGQVSASANLVPVPIEIRVSEYLINVHGVSDVCEDDEAGHVPVSFRCPEDEVEGDRLVTEEASVVPWKVGVFDDEG